MIDRGKSTNYARVYVFINYNFFEKIDLFIYYEVTFYIKKEEAFRKILKPLNVTTSQVIFSFQSMYIIGGHYR